MAKYRGTTKQSISISTRSTTAIAIIHAMAIYCQTCQYMSIMHDKGKLIFNTKNGKIRITDDDDDVQAGVCVLLTGIPSG